MSEIQNLRNGCEEQNPGGCAGSANYDEALRSCSREAAATLAAAAAVTAFFWGTLFLFSSSKASFFGFPLWFMAAVPGGYLFSIVAVVWIVKRYFRDIPLDITPDAPRKLHSTEGAE